MSALTLVLLAYNTDIIWSVYTLCSVWYTQYLSDNYIYFAMFDKMLTLNTVVAARNVYSFMLFYKAANL
jgi:hypothetical protein